MNTDIRKGPIVEALPPPYQPPPQTGYWDSSQYITEAFKQLPPEQAMKAMESAVGLEGMLGYDADVKAGMPADQALRKWQTKMYFKPQ